MVLERFQVNSVRGFVCAVACERFEVSPSARVGFTIIAMQFANLSAMSSSSDSVLICDVQSAVLDTVSFLSFYARFGSFAVRDAVRFDDSLWLNSVQSIRCGLLVGSSCAPVAASMQIFLSVSLVLVHQHVKRVIPEIQTLNLDPESKMSYYKRLTPRSQTGHKGPTTMSKKFRNALWKVPLEGPLGSKGRCYNSVPAESTQPAVPPTRGSMGQEGIETEWRCQWC